MGKGIGWGANEDLGVRRAKGDEYMLLLICFFNTLYILLRQIVAEFRLLIHCFEIY